MKTLRVIAFLCACIGTAFSQTVVVSGHLITGGGAVSSSNVSVLWELVNDSGQICKVSATGIIVPTSFTVTQAQLAAGISLIPNNLISCGSTLGVNRWRYTVKAGGIGTRQCSLNITGTTNLDSTSCLNALPTTPIPATGDSLYARLDGTNAGFTGPITGTSFNFSGNGAVGGIFTAKDFLKVCDASFYSGADDGAKILAALADSNCVTVDGSNLIGLTTAATIIIPNGKNLILPSGVFIGGASANPVIDINNFSTVIGKGRNSTVVSTQSGTANIIAFHNATNWSRLSDVAVRSEVARTAGAGIEVSGGHNVIERVLVYPVFDGITFDVASASGDNAVNDTEITDGTGGAPGAGSGGTWHCGAKIGGVSSGTVSGNIFTHVTASMRTAFTDAGFCIQDGADTTVITGGSQAAANIGGSDSVAVHLETVNGGNQPALTIITGDAFEGGLTKNTIVIDSGFNTTISSNGIQSGLRGILVNGGSGIRIESNHFHLNQQEGVRVTSNSNVTIMGNDFSESSQQTNNTFSDIFFAVGAVNFAISANKHKDFSATGKTCKFAVEIAAGGSDFYSVTDEINNGNCVSGTLSDGGSGNNKHVCNAGGPCSNGQTIGFGGDLSASRNTTSGILFFGANTNFLDFGVTNSGKFTFAGGGLTINTGVSNNGSGFQHKRGVTGCTTAASLNAVCSTTITWNTAFADTSYTVVGCTGNGIGAGIPILQAFGSKLAASISVQTLAGSAAAAQFSTIECTAVHD